ncbi:MAG: hydantoinase/oxoprolinase family protein, partial [Hyphomicrobiaceae bacterium]
QLGVGAIDAAAGVHRVVNTQLAEGIRVATVRRGVDPRRHGLLGFGGAAGLHITELARMLGIARVIVPHMASVLSAWGMLTSELRLEAVKTSVGETNTLDLDALRDLVTGMEAEGYRRMSRWFDGEISFRRTAEMRYGEQVFEIDVPLDQVDLDAPDALDRLKQAFESRHNELYAYSLPDQAPVLINLRIATMGELPRLPSEPAPASDGMAEPVSHRQIHLTDWMDVSVYGFDDLTTGQAIDGPAIIESETTTVLLRPGDRSIATAQRCLDITIGKNR